MRSYLKNLRVFNKITVKVLRYTLSILNCAFLVQLRKLHISGFWKMEISVKKSKFGSIVFHVIEVLVDITFYGSIIVIFSAIDFVKTVIFYVVLLILLFLCQCWSYCLRWQAFALLELTISTFLFYTSNVDSTSDIDFEKK